MVANNKQTSNEELLQLAIKAAKGGNRDSARVMLRQVYSRDKRNETALMWLAKIAKTKQERAQWLTRALEINPDNDAAKKAMASIKYSQAASDNKILVLFGAVAVVMIIVVVAIVLIALT